MPESFLRLGAEEQSQIYRALAPQLARSPAVLEKDVWVCWALRTLFAMPGQLPMAFKGGTSLSKVFGVIARFSEDVDVTLDYRGLAGSLDPFADGVSRTQLEKFSQTLKSFVRDHSHGVIVPYFQQVLEAELDADTFRLEVSEDGEKIRMYYPALLEPAGTYLGTSVLIELGGRNITEPSASYEIQPERQLRCLSGWAAQADS